MKTKFNTRALSLLLTILMVLPLMMPIMAVFAADEQTTYVLDPGTLPTFDSNTKAEGDTDTAGTDNFFTIHYKKATKIGDSAKDFLGFSSTKRIDFQGAINLDTVSGAISFTTQDKATIKLFWGCTSNLSQVGVYDASGEVVTQTNEEVAANGLYVTTLEIPEAGKYYLGGMTAGFYLYKLEVTTKTIDKGPRDSWDNVSAPAFASIAANEDGTIGVSVNALVDHHGADYLVVNMYQNGKIISTAKSTSLKTVHALTFNPVESGTYEFEAVISREGEVDKVSGKSTLNYTLPLAAPFITLASNLGDGSVKVIWNPTREAEKYNVYVGTTLYQTTEGRDIVISGLTMGKLAQIGIEAVRGDVISERSSINVTVGAEKRDWDFTVYGPSTDRSSNVVTENKDGSVTVKSINGKGKLQPTGPDGLAYYYTAVPSDQNFTFRAKITVNYWSFSNGQDGFGLMVMDHVPSSDYTTANFWSNLYMAVATKIEYRYEDIEDGGYEIYTTDSIYGDKYSMKLGIGSISKIGINQSIIDRTTLGEQGLIVGQTGALQSLVQTLECRAGLLGKKAGTYNIIGNHKVSKENGPEPEGNLEEYLVTEMTLEIQKNNTGYFITYYDKNGDVVRTIKNYEPDALEQFDPDYVYVGMFASRNASVTFSDISLTTIAKEDDKPAEPRPIEKIVPTVTITSASSTTTTDYNLIADFNVSGTADIYVNNTKLLEGIKVKAYERLDTMLDLSEVARYDLPNTLRVVFTPDADQELPPYTALSTTNPVWANMDITLYKGNYHRKTIYVAPDPVGMYYGNGSKEYPLDIYTAIKLVVPGQTIVLMEGTYRLEKGLRIERGINGTEENPIRMIADPEAKTRPVLDFVHMGNGITHGGNWWYFYGFDVTNSLDGNKGFQVSGNNNVLDQIHAYYNGNTGIQISRYHVADLTIDQWPANNLILNCTSYGNADSGYEDADGFAAKLTIGEGNVFDGCVAHHNADDGWDLYAKIATGEIGAVIIRNCVAYANGYLEDGTDAGNGNGFKMGGDSLPGQHQLINSIAFNNKAKGIDSNSCPDIIVKNSISYNNGSHNVAFYTNSGNNTDFVAEGIISIKDDKVAATHPGVEAPNAKESFKPLGNQDLDKYENASNYYWNGTESVNKSGTILTTDIFVSTTFTGITRNEDGSINMNGFLELNEKAPAGAGTTGASTASGAIELVPDEECTFSSEWTTSDMYIHWHECECGNKSDIGFHELEYVTDSEPTESAPGYKHNECTICGHKKASIEIPALGNGDVDTETNDTPTNAGTENAGGILGFFQMIWNAIVNFFKSLFGLN